MHALRAPADIVSGKPPKKQKTRYMIRLLTLIRTSMYLAYTGLWGACSGTAVILPVLNIEDIVHHSL